MQELFENIPKFGRNSVLETGMRMIPDRAVFTVARHNGLWAVEHDGEFFGHSSDKEVAKAEACKRARAAQDKGRPCQLRVSGENGFFAT